MANANDNWYEDGDDEPADDVVMAEYDITASPNDFNIKTIFDFIDSGAVKIPGFQRNYVWDRKRASRLIESIIIGLPIPQVFLYQDGRNSFLVIDGQQRLMSIYYFIKGRFPRKEKRAEIRRIFEEQGTIPSDIFDDDELFERFALQLSEQLPAHPNRFNKLGYATLDEYKSVFDLRTIRNVIIKQSGKSVDDDLYVYEIFNRLNTGGMNLKPQEIRTSLYHSKFYDMLYRVNALAAWRTIIGVDELDIHTKDVEILLRGFAMLVKGGEYNPSMVKFLNAFSQWCRSLALEDIDYFERLFRGFLRACDSLGAKPFHGRKAQFNVLLFEAVFAAASAASYSTRTTEVAQISAQALEALQRDDRFIQATRSQTAKKQNVVLRLRVAAEMLGV